PPPPTQTSRFTEFYTIHSSDESNYYLAIDNYLSHTSMASSTGSFPPACALVVCGRKSPTRQITATNPESLMVMHSFRLLHITINHPVPSIQPARPPCIANLRNPTIFSAASRLGWEGQYACTSTSCCAHCLSG